MTTAYTTHVTPPNSLTSLTLEEMAEKTLEFGKLQQQELVQELINANPMSWDMAQGTYAQVTLTGDHTLSPTGLVGGVCNLLVTQDYNGGHVLKYGFNVKWPNGTPPILSTGANETDLLCFHTDGRNLYGLTSSKNYLGQWNQISGPYFGTGWMSVSYCNNMFIATGSTGQISTSSDGLTWTASSGHGDVGGGCAYGAGVYVAVAANSSNIVTSPDAVTWTAATVPNSGSRSPRMIAFGNDVFVIFCGGSTVRYSYDGLTWSTVTLPISIGSAQEIIFGNGVFLLWNTNSSSAYVRSTDGIHWTVGNFPNIISNNSRGAFGNGTFVIAGSSIVYSTDGINWSGSYIDDHDLGDLFYGDGYFSIVPTTLSKQYIPVSSDGKTWSNNRLPISRVWATGCYGDGKYVIMSLDGTILTSN